MTAPIGCEITTLKSKIFVVDNDDKSYLQQNRTVSVVRFLE
jgi:hypothetical protein